jgi:hypothetical protein
MTHWQFHSLGLPPIIEIFGFRIEVIPGWWTLIVIPAAGILVFGILARLISGPPDEESD